MRTRPHGSRFHSARHSGVLLMSIVLALLMMGAPAIQAQTQAPPPPTEIPPPTAVPPTEIPPPTAIPPTEIPATEVPSTEVPVTEVPTEPATEVPTETPESTPRPFPTDPPPPPPPVQDDTPREAGKVDVTCKPLDTIATPVADPGDWVLLTCALDLSTDGLESIELHGQPIAPGWRVIVLEPNAPNTPGLLDASNNRATLTDLEGQSQATFLIGTQRTCTGIPETTLELEIKTLQRKATSPTTYTAELPLKDAADPAPTVSLDHATVTDGIGSVRVSWEGASADCGWSLQVQLEGADEVSLTTVEAPSGTLAAVSDGGVLAFVIPPGNTSGQVQVELAVEGDVPTSVVVQAVTYP